MIERTTYAGPCPFDTHYAKTIQAKHIDDCVILPLIGKLSTEACLHMNVTPPSEFGWVMTWDLGPHFAVPWKVLMAKLRGLKARDLIDGCTCGCRGDFVLTESGRALVASWAAETN